MKYKVQIFSIGNQDEWDGILKRMHGYDFYHTYSYNLYYSGSDSYPIIFSFTCGDVSICMPMIIRTIPATQYKDVTSSYGYAGPLSTHEFTDIEIVRLFNNELNAFFKENSIISAFSRLHPSLSNDYLLFGLGSVKSLSDTVFIDLSKTTDEQRKQYKKGVKSDLSKLNRGEFQVYEDTTKEFLDEFIDIYNENMLRVGAKEEYFFNRKYYETIFYSKDINSKLLFVVKNGEMISGSIFVFTGNIIQYHLSATKSQFLKNSPVRLLIEYIRQFGTENGFRELHLGGGVGSVSDSLFNFKAGFSDCRHNFKIWKYIVNESVYNQLVLNKGSFNDLNYFPLYRSV